MIRHVTFGYLIYDELLYSPFDTRGFPLVLLSECLGWPERLLYFRPP